MARICTGDTGSGPREKSGRPESEGTSTAVNRANATATAAIVPVWITVSIAQPKRKPASGPYASRKNTYCPPARGSIAASSAHEREAITVRTPAAIQTPRRPDGEPTRRALSAETMKMPEPIMDPTTSAVASKRRMARRRWDAGAAVILAVATY